MIVKYDEDDDRENAGGGEGVDNLIDDTSFDQSLLAISKDSWKNP